MTCSPSQNRQLFDAARSGLGHVVGARVRLIPAPPRARLYQAFYNNLPAFLSDLETLIDDGRFDTVQGFAVSDGTGGWLYQLETTKYFAPGDRSRSSERSCKSSKLRLCNTIRPPRKAFPTARNAVTS